MKEIGKFLRENRIQQELSISDISKVTKMNINIIKNIETGNIAYFNNDLTYLRYYVRSYANAVNVDFDSLVDELEKSTLTYTQSIAVLEREKIKTLNENIKSKKQKVSQPLQRGGLVKPRGNIDWTLVSLITIITLIGAFLIYSVVINLTDKEPTDNQTPINNKPIEKEPEEEEPVDETPIIVDVEITKEDPNTYLISKWDVAENFNIKTEFGVNTWVQIRVNDVVINPPGETTNSKTYLIGEELVMSNNYKVNEAEFEFKANDIITIRYGIMRGNKFFINDVEYQLDESIANATGGTNVTFKLDSEVE